MSISINCFKLKFSTFYIIFQGRIGNGTNEIIEITPPGKNFTPAAHAHIGA